MTAKEQGLPELPESVAAMTACCRMVRVGFSLSASVMHDGHCREKNGGVLGKTTYLYTADQMRAYALAALASDTGERGVVVNPEIIGNPDAAAWADYFAKTHPESTISRDVMVGWFANAMMAAHDHALAKPVKITPDVLAAVAGYYHDGPVRNWDVVRAIESSIAAIRAQPAGGGCDWQQQDRGGDWVSTACGNEFVLNDASQYKEGEQVFPHCPYCAKPATFHNWEASK